jgi:aminomethyltransferase
VVDDLIVYLHRDEQVVLVPNAANTAEVVRRLAEAAPPGVEVTDRHRDYGVLAVQGPRSAELLGRLGLPADHEYMSFTESTWDGRPLVVCRTGYTGEHGYELLPRWDGAPALWDALLAAGEDLGVRPCGLGARDTLRTEMGYPLHGQDLSLQITPVQARCGWAVGWSKPAFWGRDVLLKEKEAGPRRLLWGLLAEDRGIPRPHLPVLRPAADGDDTEGRAGEQVGEVTSGTFSPTLRRGVGLALLSRAAGLGAGDEVVVDIRGRPSRMQVARPPFVPNRTST